MHLAKKLAASVLALSLTALLPSCDAGITSPSVDHLGANPPAVRLERSELQLVAGDTARLTAQVVSASGTPVSGQGVSWSSSAPEVVSVGRDGTVSALQAGEATVTASAGKASATAIVRVSSVAVLRISPKEDTLNTLGATIALAATVLDPRGEPVPSASITWASLDPAVAVVDAEGQVTSLGMGVARITGGSGGKTDTVRVHVKNSPVSLRLRPKDAVLGALGDTLRLKADGQDATGRALDPAAVKWTSLSPAVATVDGVGLVTARATGTARVAAEYGGRADTVQVEVRQLVASIAVTPGAPTVQAGQAQQMVAAAKDANGNDIPGVTFAWMSSNPAAAVVSGAGVVSAVAPGVSYVTATAGSRSGTATVTVTANPGTVPARIAIEPEAGTLDAIGASAQLGATVYSAAGGAMTGVATSWSSLDAGVAAVDGAGRVTARAAGTARIVATAGALADTAVMTVRQVVASVAVSPSAPAVQAGQAQQLTATARDANGNDVPGVAFAWTSSNPAAATVDGSGTLRGVAAGVSYVTAAAAGKSAVATVTVTADPGTVASRVSVTPEAATLDALGATAQLGATVYSAAGTAMAGAPLAWSSLDAGVATTDASGRVTARAVGTARIVATSGTLVDTATVTVRQVVASVAVTPTSPVVQEGGTQQLTAAASDANGNAVPTAAFAWTSSNPAAATVDAAGTVRAVAAGVSYVTASAGGRTATATVTVNAAAPVQAPVATVSVAPGSASVVVGGSVLVTASARDAAGNVLTGRAVTWSSSNPAVAAVSASGMVTGAAAGSAVVTATVEGKTGTASVTVSADPATTPARIAVTPGSDTLGALGAATQLKATVYSASGAVMSGTSVSWTSLSAGVATTDAAGRVTARAVGTARIVAAAGSLADTATVVVRQVVASVAVSPSAPVVQEGATQQVAATARDANGNDVAGAAFTWTSSNAAAATVNGSGLVSGVAAGVSYVTASAGGKSAVATVTVSAPAVATVTVSPGSASIAVGGTVDLSAVARDGAGRILTGRPVTWASSNPAVATVSATGLVTGVAGGAATITATSEGKSGTATVTVSAPAPVGSTLVYAHDFNDGTIGTFGQWGGYTPQPVSVVADPTGSGRGSVARVVYERDPASGGSPDVNAGLYARVNPAGGHPSGVGFGERIYIAGDFYLPRYPYTAPAQAQYDLRKLFYIKFGDPNSRSGHIVVNAYGRADKSGLDLGLASGLYGSSHYLQDYGLGSIGFDRWHRLEVEIVANHKGMSDGVVRMWLNGQLVRERTGAMLFSPSPSEASDFIYEYGIGNQEQWQSGDMMKDYRLWDNIQFRTGRP